MPHARGETDFLLRIVAKDWDAYQKFVTERLTAAPKVANVKSALAIRSAKHLPGVPIAVDPAVPNPAARRKPRPEDFPGYLNLTFRTS